ncbi:MAG: copper resistance protein CopC, partial [Actinobacteria bacterium]|nr:copper resistance protein CopC [Actinomycetota bacterium]
MKGRRIVDGILVAALVGALMFASAGAAQGHAAIVSSTPAAGEELSAAPGVVRLTFSESLIQNLSKAVVVAPDGRRYEGGPSSERKVEIRLTTNIPGIYLVEWKTVSPVDGHSLQGRFQFGVGVKPGHQAETTLSPRRGELALAALRALEYAGLLVAVGVILLTALARRKPQLDLVVASLRVPLSVALVAGIGVVGGEAMLASTDASQVPEFLRTLPGLARLLRIGFEAAALAFTPWLLATAINLTLSLIALAAAGHAAAVRPAIVGITTDAVHLIAAGMWAGGIIVLAIIAKRPGAGKDLLDRFTPFAIPAFL